MKMIISSKKLGLPMMESGVLDDILKAFNINREELENVWKASFVRIYTLWKTDNKLPDNSDTIFKESVTKPNKWVLFY